MHVFAFHTLRCTKKDTSYIHLLLNGKIGCKTHLSQFKLFNINIAVFAFVYIYICENSLSLGLLHFYEYLLYSH